MKHITITLLITIGMIFTTGCQKEKMYKCDKYRVVEIEAYNNSIQKLDKDLTSTEVINKERMELLSNRAEGNMEELKETTERYEEGQIGREELMQRVKGDLIECDCTFEGKE